MNKVKVILLIILFVAARAYSQGATATLGTVIACPADTILVPVNVTNFTNIAAITLFVSYNGSVLSFQGLSNVHPSLSGISSNAMTTPVVQVGIAWSSIIPFTVVSGKLFDLKFVLTGGNCSMSITNETEIVDNNLNIISFTRYSGNVTQNSTPVILSQPQDLNVKAGDDATFYVSVTGATSYQWLVSSDGGNTWTNVLNISPYSGSNNNVLHISLVTAGFNNRKYRCKANGICSAYSNSATLTVDTVTAIDPVIENGIILGRNYPNPCNDYTCIDYSIDNGGDIKYEIINSLGQIVKYKEYNNITSGNNKLIVDCSGICEGIYFCRIEIKSLKSYYSQTIMITIAR